MHLENLIPDGEKKVNIAFFVCFHIGQRSGQAVLASPGCDPARAGCAEDPHCTRATCRAGAALWLLFSSRKEASPRKIMPQCPKIAPGLLQGPAGLACSGLMRHVGDLPFCGAGWGAPVPSGSLAGPHIAGVLPGPRSDSHLL